VPELLHYVTQRETRRQIIFTFMPRLSLVNDWRAFLAVDLEEDDLAGFRLQSYTG